MRMSNNEDPTLNGYFSKSGQIKITNIHFNKIVNVGQFIIQVFMM
jgi:hypothetical protein